MSDAVRALRVHPTSAGLEPAALVAGHDLVFDLDPAHGLELADGVLAHDELDTATCWEIHEASLATLARARERIDGALLVGDLQLAWIWEFWIEKWLVTLTCRAEALRRAVARHEVGELVVADGADERTRQLVAAVGAATGVAVRAPSVPADASSAVDGIAAGTPAAAAARSLRRRLAGAARQVGLPSRLRPGSTILVSYWPLLPLLDRMLSGGELRPAVLLERPPSGPARSLRAARLGGWIGTPGLRVRRRAAADAADVLRRVAELDLSGFAVRGIDLGAALQGEVLRIAGERVEGDLASAAVLRSAFARTPPASLVASWDVEPSGRLIVSLARDAGVRTLVLAHGAFLLPQTLVDMDVCDEPILWTEAVAPPLPNRDRPVHAIGYPVPHDAAPPTRVAPAGRPRRVLVLGQPALMGMALDHPRVTMRQYDVAIRAVLARAPDATIVLRPHPAEGPDAVAASAARFPDATFEIDRGPSIAAALQRCDLCIGTITTATLQSALHGAPAIALNLSRFAWRWPLGGETSVPVARDAAQLAAWLERWDAGDAPLPGRDDMLAALGADPAGGDPTERLLAIVAGTSPAPPAGEAGAGAGDAAATAYG